LKVLEYFLFDPTEDYLDPPLQGYRLIDGEYVRIEPVAGRPPSEILGLHLERDGTKLRLFDPATGRRLLTPVEGREAAEQRAAEERQNAEEEGNAPPRNGNALPRSGNAPRLPKPLSSSSLRSTSASGGRSRPSDADEASPARRA
jgi:hypothetical protein